MAGAHLPRGGKTKKRVEEKERPKKPEKPRDYGIFRIEFSTWFPWFRATARKEERVGASFFYIFFSL